MFLTDGQFVHPLQVESISLPKKFTFPFYYEPHELSKIACTELQNYLESQTDWEHNFGLDQTKQGFSNGKMFGVLVVETPENELGYLAAFSGKLANSNFINGFVPPIFDTLNKEGFYKKGEAILNQMSQQIETLEQETSLEEADQALKRAKQQQEQEISTWKQELKQAKKKRDLIRKEQQEKLSETAYNELKEELKKQSLYYQFRLRDLKEHWETEVSQKQTTLEGFTKKIEQLKIERRNLSNSLQQQIHQRYHFLNANGEQKDLLQIFSPTIQQIPPAGSGECAAPKLLQYAYENNLRPVCLAEFWWGESPKSEIRKHKNYYPSCKGKCEPILGHMLQGLTVDDNPMKDNPAEHKTIKILFEDEHLLAVNKPAEMLSVPGRLVSDSVKTRLQALYPTATGPLLVHRIDMSTSGILLVAKNEYIHKRLQRQFINKTIKKRYVALLDGSIDQPKGKVELPLTGDYLDRPRQKVCHKEGKPAITHFEVIEKTDNITRIYFYPITGRTHQLRVHAAHQNGLNAPILGDDLYGTKANRLHLHAELLVFTHPITKKTIRIQSKPDF